MTDLTPHALILEHAATPIIDAVAREICISLEEDPDALDTRYELRGWRLYRSTARASLRAALPWELPAERLEAMARRACPAPNAPTLWMEYSEKTLAAYRADPIMRELWPEHKVEEYAKAQHPMPGTPIVDSKTAINKRVQARYDKLMLEGKHGHYETMFRVVHEELAAQREHGQDQREL